ncbi:hypothetical protein ThidrDRAFT_3115 [Thiorhodococcus drewsii AZ1]|uniref:Uncharacterized protein n=1 Tax=Thiorhodococcus drewsii AZ1 TaxID=765913 RepID=G2E4A2_9GAMM|nr:hypothetical protein [Thiorhodococcus drewsii]EGV29829.1 hypothetical protein ThidrDRAFT_3115 [Thiorhodococcus drewsii AZ1]
MATMERLELAAQSSQLVKDVRHLVEKYRSIFAWDVPELDQELSDTMILTAIRQALDAVEEDLRRRAAES